MMRKICVVVLAVYLFALAAGVAMAQNLVADSGFDGQAGWYSTYNSVKDEWFDVATIGEPNMPWVSCSQLWNTSVTYGWSAIESNRLRVGQYFYKPTTLAPGSNGLENIGGL